MTVEVNVVREEPTGKPPIRYADVKHGIYKARIDSAGDVFVTCDNEGSTSYFWAHADDFQEWSQKVLEIQREIRNQ